MENKDVEYNNSKINYSFCMNIFAIAFVSLAMTLCSSSRGAMGDIAYSPGGNGFAYKSVGVPQKGFSKWATQNKEKIQKTIDGLGDDSVLEIVGHTDSSGPREKKGSRRGNIWYSTARARAVYNALIKNGFKRSKLSYKGIADDELLDSGEPNSQINRRVNFRIVSKK